MAGQPQIDSKYSIGIPEMDRQHARWISLIEEFRRSIDRAAGPTDDESLEASRSALKELVFYTKTHFASEEALLERHSYPDIALHRKRHAELVSMVEGLMAEISSMSTRTTPLKLNLAATVWLMEHIMGEDKKYADFILEKQRASRG